MRKMTGFLNLITLKRLYRIPREIVILSFGKNVACSERWLIEKERLLAPSVVQLPAVFSQFEKRRVTDSLNHGGDKMSSRRHGYARTYSKLLQSLPDHGALLEVGVLTGISLGVWSQAKPYWKIFGLDLDLNRFHTNLQFLRDFGCFQTQDPTVLEFDCYSPNTDELKKCLLAQSIAGFHLIIDDGPHTDESILTTFQALFPLISDGGRYVVEDNLTVKRELAALAIRHGGMLTRKGDLLIVSRENR
jgi:hypothetical protein